MLHELKAEKIGVKFEQVLKTHDEALEKWRMLKDMGFEEISWTKINLTMDEFIKSKRFAI